MASRCPCVVVFYHLWKTNPGVSCHAYLRRRTVCNSFTLLDFWKLSSKLPKLYSRKNELSLSLLSQLPSQAAQLTLLYTSDGQEHPGHYDRLTLYKKNNKMYIHFAPPRSRVHYYAKMFRRGRLIQPLGQMVYHQFHQQNYQILNELRLY